MLAEASYAVIWAAQVAPTVIDPSGGATHAYGFGWDIDHLGAHPIVRHAGGDLGYQSFILLAPDDATAVVTMGNRLDTFTEPFYTVDIGTTVVKLLLGDEHDVGERG